jgi:branched-subunit amino acid ABC-type transport system permease component
MGRILGGVVLFIWGMYSAIGVVLRALNQDLTDAGALGELTGGSICSLILLGGGIALVASGWKSTVDPTIIADSRTTMPRSTGIRSDAPGDPKDSERR